jgi:hypothetical protein
VLLTGLQRIVYQALRGEYRRAEQVTRRDRLAFARMGQCVRHLLMAGTNPGLLANRVAAGEVAAATSPGQVGLAGALRGYGRRETPRKFAVLARLVADATADRKKVVVWSYFPGNLEQLRRQFARYHPAVVHGGVPSNLTQPDAPVTREAELERFLVPDGPCRVLLASPAATGEGVSLHRVCHDAIFLERTFHAGLFLQSLDRIHRLGLAPDQETRITFLVTSGTIDELVDERLRLKTARLGRILDDPDLAVLALPDEEIDSDDLLGLDEDDLAALLNHLGESDVP